MLHEVWEPGDAKSNRQVSDEELVDRFQAGDELSFNELFHRYNQELCNYLRWKTKNDEDARRLANDVFFKVYNWLRTNKGKDMKNFKAWLYRITNNCANDHWRNIKTNIKRFLQWEDCFESAVFIEGPEEHVERIERAEIVRMAIRSIPEKYHLPLYFYYIENRKQSEIASFLRMSERSVRRHIAEGTEKFTLAYKQLGGGAYHG